jgi:hypothetical protein
MKWCKKTVDLDDAVAMKHYDYGLEAGFLREKDLKIEMDFYKKGADLGDAGAMLNFSLGLTDGSIEGKDLKGAME